MRKSITKRAVDALKPGEVIADGEVRGFYVRRLPSGVATYGFRYRDKMSGKRRWLSLGLHGQVTPEDARTLARKHAGAVADRRDPLQEQANARAAAARQAGEPTVDDLLDDFLARHVRKGGLRTADEVERVLKVYVRPRIGRLAAYGLRRSKVVAMLDEIEDANGPVMADRALAYVRKAFNWKAARDDDFNSPIVKGMARTRPKERARARILDDQEIRDIWAALPQVTEAYARLVRVLFVSVQRRDEVARLEWPELDRKSNSHPGWIIPPERYKTKLYHFVPLPPVAWDFIGERQGETARYVVSTTKGKKPFSGFSKAKRELDAEITKLRKEAGRKPMPRWVLHDIRRTGRSLMSRAGVAPHVAERVLGHVIPGVEGTYDRYSYAEEKRDALEKLAALLKQILSPPVATVAEVG